MKKLTLRQSILPLSILLVLLSFFFMNLGNLGDCQSSFCLRVPSTIGEPLFFISAPLIIIGFILLFVSENVYKSWKKFAMVFVPIEVIIIFSVPTRANMFDPDREMVALWLSSLFLLLSIVIILLKHFRSKRGEKIVEKNPQE